MKGLGSMRRGSWRGIRRRRDPRFGRRRFIIETDTDTDTPDACCLEERAESAFERPSFPKAEFPKVEVRSIFEIRFPVYVHDTTSVLLVCLFFRADVVSFVC